jgi:hypothetical protein
LLAAALCALPAEGANPTLTHEMVSVLTPLDTVPSRVMLDKAFPAELALAQLRDLALGGTTDLGIQLRAIRALPSYCPPGAGTCGPDTMSHDTLIEIIGRYRDSPDAAQAPQDILRLRAAAEALGATRSGLPEDVDALLALLGDGDKEVPGHRSLDVRASAARAIGQLCNRGAHDALLPHLIDPSPQVVEQVTRALQNLDKCVK